MSVGDDDPHTTLAQGVERDGVLAAALPVSFCSRSTARMRSTGRSGRGSVDGVPGQVEVCVERSTWQVVREGWGRYRASIRPAERAVNKAAAQPETEARRKGPHATTRNTWTRPTTMSPFRVRPGFSAYRFIPARLSDRMVWYSRRGGASPWCALGRCDAANLPGLSLLGPVASPSAGWSRPRSPTRRSQDAGSASAGRLVQTAQPALARQRQKDAALVGSCVPLKREAPRPAARRVRHALPALRSLTGGSQHRHRPRAHHGDAPPTT